ncbi:uncharacterized protein PAC_15771 [Phialocephala subalpina]|uniref:C2H2-type domain-containing protein n=1 Tax=Phialocephala subalpina TaxID=576137 RepID=A0A1L7XLD6_9HELO|nr:uncharacterized protein PAC_15771 [Phialocephala subalpina]
MTPSWACMLCPDRRIFNSSQELWEHDHSDHAEQLPIENEAECGQLESMISEPARDTRASRCPGPFEDFSIPPNAYHKFPMIDNMPSMTFPSGISIQEGPPFYDDAWSRDQTPPHPSAFLANNPGLLFNHSASFLNFTSYEAADVSLQNGVHSAFGFPPTHEPTAQAGPARHWQQDADIGSVLQPPIPQIAFHESRIEHVSETSMFQSRLPDAEVRDDFDDINMISMPVFHAQTHAAVPNTCQECNTVFRNKATLDSHASQTQHAPYICICGKACSRFDVLNRHVDKFNPKALYPCPYCSRFSGLKGFHRLDHLTQHLQTYHNIDRQSPARTSIKKPLICPYEECPSHSRIFANSPSPENPDCIVFRTRKDFTEHLRQVHNDSLFPCTVLGCDRIGGKGYFRKRDLLKHEKEHNHEFTSSDTSQFSSP